MALIAHPAQGGAWSTLNTPLDTLLLRHDLKRSSVFLKHITGILGIIVSHHNPMLVSSVLYKQLVHCFAGSTGYSQSFEHDVLAMLQKMNDRMANMKSNPTVTEKEVGYR